MASAKAGSKIRVLNEVRVRGNEPSVAQPALFTPFFPFPGQLKKIH
jgi:hypothetical protein